MQRQLMRLIGEILGDEGLNPETRMSLLRHISEHPGHPEQAMLAHLHEIQNRGWNPTAPGPPPARDFFPRPLEWTMKTRAALALSVAGILVTGSAALAVNTQVLNTTPAGTGNASSVLLPNNSGRTPSPAAAVVSSKATPDARSVAVGGSSAPAKTAGAPEAGDDKGGRRTTPETGDDRDTKVGTVTRKSDAGPDVSQPDRTAGSQPDAGPDVSQPDRTAGSQPDAGPAVVSIQPGDDKGGLRTFPEQGSDQRGQRKASEPGDDSGGHGSDDWDAIYTGAKLPESGPSALTRKARSDCPHYSIIRQNMGTTRGLIEHSFFA
jgi:hypothetical protein